MSRPTAGQLREYGAAANGACRALGIAPEAQRQAYRRGVVRELTGRESVRDVRSAEEFDAVMARLWADAGGYARAIHYRIGAERRTAHVVRVLACQLMQLKGGSEADAQAYVGGILDQAKVPNGRDLADGSWWMDVSPQRLRAAAHPPAARGGAAGVLGPGALRPRLPDPDRPGSPGRVL